MLRTWVCGLNPKRDENTHLLSLQFVILPDAWELAVRGVLCLYRTS